jgi:hypothetical protein
MTYCYGSVLNAAAGVTSMIFVQTRDSYGNAAIVDAGVYPQGTEEVVFELCLSVGTDISASCFGGEVERGVGITMQYGIGPDNSNINPDTQLPYYGLYQVISLFYLLIT